MVMQTNWGCLFLGYGCQLDPKPTVKDSAALAGIVGLSGACPSLKSSSLF